MRKFVITVISGKFVFNIGQSPMSEVRSPKSKEKKFEPQSSQRAQRNTTLH